MPTFGGGHELFLSSLLKIEGGIQQDRDPSEYQRKVTIPHRRLPRGGGHLLGPQE
jgi:hypothetical protein